MRGKVITESFRVLVVAPLMGAATLLLIICSVGCAPVATATKDFVDIIRLDTLSLIVDDIWSADDDGLATPMVRSFHGTLYALFPSVNRDGTLALFELRSDGWHRIRLALPPDLRPRSGRPIADYAFLDDSTVALLTFRRLTLLGCGWRSPFKDGSGDTVAVDGDNRNRDLWSVRADIPMPEVWNAMRVIGDTIAFISDMYVTPKSDPHPLRLGLYSSHNLSQLSSQQLPVQSGFPLTLFQPRSIMDVAGGMVATSAVDRYRVMITSLRGEAVAVLKRSPQGWIDSPDTVGTDTAEKRHPKDIIELLRPRTTTASLISSVHFLDDSTLMVYYTHPGVYTDGIYRGRGPTLAFDIWGRRKGAWRTLVADIANISPEFDEAIDRAHGIPLSTADYIANGLILSVEPISLPIQGLSWKQATERLEAWAAENEIRYSVVVRHVRAIALEQK